MPKMGVLAKNGVQRWGYSSRTAIATENLIRYSERAQNALSEYLMAFFSLFVFGVKFLVKNTQFAVFADLGVVMV